MNPMTVPAATMVLSSSCCAIGPEMTVVVASGPIIVLVTRPTVVEVISGSVDLAYTAAELLS